ncbi:hypothetical protein CHS0354_010662 [Potamilus streckersoni]|uniref:Uncharacterized protein n=1 Tax=Potamilus streckersoni TaxID=2493646 RepID=A0AAE0TC56_9BIVA|nr:hypothetical protein CHS0354_010662 [Potamilus streckersoni]
MLSGRLGHFTVMATTGNNNSLLLYQEKRDVPGRETDIYLYVNITVPVSIISVLIPYVERGDNILTICEFEAYRAEVLKLITNIL